MVCRASCWYLVGSAGSVHFSVALLCCVSLRACIELRISWCPFLCVGSGLVWCWVSSCRVMWRGGASCGVPLWLIALWCVMECCSCVRFCVLRWGWFGVRFRRVVFSGVVARLVAFRCGTLPCGVLRCDVLLLLFPVKLVRLSFCGVALWQFVWSFSLLSFVVWLIIGVLCWYVSCASLLSRVAPCFMSLCSIMRSYGSCIVSWRLLCCGVLCCRGVFRCVGVYVGVRRGVLSHGVVCRFLAVCCFV